MINQFTIQDNYKGRPITATVKVDTTLNDHDMLLIEVVKDERGNELEVTEELREQVLMVFFQEHESEYNSLLEAVEQE